MVASLESELDAALRHLMTKRNRLVRDYAANLGLTPEQFAILVILRQLGSGITIGAIADHLDAPHANVTRTLARPEKKGLVRRSPDSADRRRMQVHLTLEGKKLLGEIARAEAEILRGLWGDYSELDKEALLRLLQR
jgi:DNA-binding MarR family transcriptional regulator